MDTWQYGTYMIAAEETDERIVEVLDNFGNQYYELVSVAALGQGRAVCILRRPREDDPPRDTTRSYLVKSSNENINNDTFAQALTDFVGERPHELVAVVPRGGKVTCFFKFISESE